MRNCFAAQFRESRNPTTACSAPAPTCCGDYIPFVTTSNAYCPPSKNQKAATAMRRAHDECPPSNRCQKRSVLPDASPLTACYLSRICNRFRPQIRSITSSHIQPVSPFVVASRSAPPVSAQTIRALPCSRIAELPLASTWTTLPHYGLSITRLTKPGTARPSAAAAVVPALAILFASWVTSLSDVTPRTPQPYVRTFRRDIVSASTFVRAISEDRT